jgi:hypothetical protein
MIIKLTKFGKTKLVKASPHNMKEDETPEEVLWVERSEDYYALLAKRFLHKKVAIVERKDWLRADEID